VSNIPEVFTTFQIPSGKYAVFQIRTKYKFMLGIAISRMKRYIYNQWMRQSQYEFGGYEFEYNNESMSQKNPYYIDLYVAVKDKNTD
jgi:predicted transcriptional regulator YdeE